MNSMAKSVLPHPGPPLMSAGLPLGRPPPLISSNPLIPDGTFCSSGPGLASFVTLFAMQPPSVSNPENIGKNYITGVEGINLVNVSKSETWFTASAGQEPRGRQ